MGSGKGKEDHSYGNINKKEGEERRGEKKLASVGVCAWTRVLAREGAFHRDTAIQKMTYTHSHTREALGVSLPLFAQGVTGVGVWVSMCPSLAVVGEGGCVRLLVGGARWRREQH